MILYRKGPHLRLRRASAPAAPYWAATTIAPYAARRASPIAVDYLDLRATSAERLEVNVSGDAREELERATQRQPLREPVLIEATERAELVFRRGEDALRFCEEQQAAALLLLSARGALPERVPPDTTIAIAAWPLELEQLGALFQQAADLRWGVAVPVIYPVTTDLAALRQLATMARDAKASFFAGFAVDLDPTAKQALSQSAENETYEMLFHADLEPIQIATERHIAALAAEHGMADFIVPPRWEQRSNWNASIVLMLAASRMIDMDYELELAGALARSARVVAELDKPIERIAAAASLSIVEALDEASVDILSDWIASGRSAFVERVNGLWRLRRDHGLN